MAFARTSEMCGKQTILEREECFEQRGELEEEKGDLATKLFPSASAQTSDDSTA